MQLPSALILVNNTSSIGLATLISQLKIDEKISFDEFNARVLINPNYASEIHLNNLRVLVVLNNFHDQTNRQLFDLALFIKNGLVSVEKNNTGGPALTFALDRINVYEILRFNKSNQVVILPPESRPPPPYGLRGIVADQLADSSGVHVVNPDNEANNIDFINRK